MTRGRMLVAEYKQTQKVSPNPCKRADAETVYKALVSSSRGREFEEEILKACEHYRRAGRAVINKVSEPYMVLAKYEHGKFLGQHTGAAEPDFKGVLKGGRAVAFEAKYTSKSRIQRNVLTQDQMDWLEEQENMGAISFVCICIRDRFFSVPWALWRDMKEIFGKKYLMPADIIQYEVPYKQGVMFLDCRNLPFEALCDTAVR